MSTSGPLGSSKPTGPGYPLSGVYNVTPPTPADGQPVAFQVDSQGNLLVNVAVGGGGSSNASVGLTGATAPTSATEIGFVDVSGKLQHATGLDLTNANALTVAIVDGSGNQITSFGGGTQYADGTTQATPTGTVALGKNPSNVLHSLALDASGNLLVDIAAGNTQYSEGSTLPTATGTLALGKNPSSDVISALALNAGGSLLVTGAQDIVGSTVALNALNAAASIAMSGMQGVGFFLAAGNFAGVLVAEVCYDNGVSNTWIQTFFYNPTNGSLLSGVGFGGPNSATEYTILVGGGVSNVRVRVSSYTSGSANCTLRATATLGNVVTSPTVVQGTNPWITSDNHFPASVALSDALANPTTTEIGVNNLGWDATNSVWRRLQVDAGTGTLKVDGSGSTQPVSGTVTANQGGAPWTVKPDGTVWTLTGTSANVDVTNTVTVTLASTTITGTVAVTQSTSPWVTADNHFPASVALADNLANPTTTEIGANLLGWDATNTVWRRIQVDPNTGVLKVDGSASTQPTSDVHFPAATALSDTLVNPTTTEIGANNLGWDATNSVWRRLQVDAGTGVLKVDGSGFTQPVSGSVSVSNAVFVQQDTFPWSTSDSHFPASVALSDALANPTTTEIGANLLGWDATNTVWRRVQVDAGTGTLKVDGSGSTQPVSGTVSISGTVGVTQSTSPWVTSDNHFPASAALADNSANPTTTEIGAMNFGWDATNSVWNRLQVDAGTGTLKVDGSGSTQPVSGTVTVNQGTNPWAISAASLPLPANAAQETGGNLALIASQTAQGPQINDILNAILDNLRLLNRNVASTMPGADSEPDSFTGV